MGLNWNSFNIAGNIGKDVDKKHLANGRIVYEFSLAWNPARKDKDGDWLPANWFNCSIFCSEGGEKYFDTAIQTGNNVMLSGQMSMTRWKPRDSETSVNMFKLQCDQVKIISQNGDAKAPSGGWAEDEDEPREARSRGRSAPSTRSSSSSQSSGRKSKWDDEDE